jgi:hypothetical protein
MTARISAKGQLVIPPLKASRGMLKGKLSTAALRDTCTLL